MAGIAPEKWGSSLWQALHWVAAGYPEKPTPDDRQHYNTWLRSYVHILPCDECKHVSIQIIAKYPPQLGTRDALFAWTVDFHNRVSEHIGGGAVELDAMRARYELPEIVKAPVIPPTPAPVAPTPVAPPVLAPKVATPKVPAMPKLAGAQLRMAQQRLIQNRAMGIPQALDIRAPPEPRLTKAPPAGARKSGCNCGGRKRT